MVTHSRPQEKLKYRSLFLTGPGKSIQHTSGRGWGWGEGGGEEHTKESKHCVNREAGPKHMPLLRFRVGVLWVSQTGAWLVHLNIREGFWEAHGSLLYRAHKAEVLEGRGNCWRSYINITIAVIYVCCGSAGCYLWVCTCMRGLVSVEGSCRLLTKLKEC